MTPARRRSVTQRRLLWSTSLAAVVLGSLAIGPDRVGAQQAPGEERPGGRPRAQVAVDIDVLRSEDVAVTQALSDVQENVRRQQEELEAAEQALAEAEKAVQEADAAVAEAQQRILDLDERTDLVVVDAFVNPPTESAIEALSSESLTDSTVKQAILHRHADSDAELLGELQQAMDDLDAEMARREKAASEAAARRAEAEAALADVEEALSQQAAFVLAVQQRLDRTLSEAEWLKDIDPALAEELLARQEELAAVLRELEREQQAEEAKRKAAELAEKAQANKYTGAVIKPVPGGVVTINCPAGGKISLAGDIADAVQRLLNDAAAAGITMCGYGYRDPQDQINVRRRNCGTSHYAIWQMPSSSCRPPTARPGTSMHEQGLAIDFTCGGGGTVSYGDVCHNWLRANAGNYGLYQLPSEPWHWSVDGN